jgi:hypothetical protein
MAHGFHVRLWMDSVPSSPPVSRWLDSGPVAGTFVRRQLHEIDVDAPLMVSNDTGCGPPGTASDLEPSLKSLDRTYTLALMLPVICRAPSDPFPNEPVGLRYRAPEGGERASPDTPRRN